MSHQQDLKELITAFSGQKAVIAVPRPYLDFTGDIDIALLFSQLVYWTDSIGDEDGWFPKSYADMKTEIGLAEYTVRKSVKWLQQRKYIETTVRKHNGDPTVHYKVVMEKFIPDFTAFLRKQRNQTEKPQIPFPRKQRNESVRSRDVSYKNQIQESKEQQQEEKSVVASLVSDLVAVGVTSAEAKRLTSQFAEAHIRKHLDASHWKDTNNPPGALVTAIREDWPVKPTIPRPNRRERTTRPTEPGVAPPNLKAFLKK